MRPNLSSKMSSFFHRFNEYVIQINLANWKILPKYTMQIDGKFCTLEKRINYTDGEFETSLQISALHSSV